MQLKLFLSGNKTKSSSAHIAQKSFSKKERKEGTIVNSHSHQAGSGAWENATSMGTALFTAEDQSQGSNEKTIYVNI